MFEFVNGKTEVAKAESTEPQVKADLGIKLFKHGGRGGPAYIDRVVRGGPAHSAKLKADDLVVAINGEKVGSIRQFDDVVDMLKPEEEVLVVVKRGTELLRVPLTPRAKK